MELTTTPEQSKRRRWPILKPLAPEKGGPRISVDRPVCVVGARSRVHLPLDSELVSRCHALIVNDADETYVRDLASLNRVFLNGHSVREARLKRTDVLRIGPYKFECVAGLPRPGVQSDGDNDWDSDGAQGSSATPASVLQMEGQPDPIPLESRTLLIGTRPGCDLVLPKGAGTGVHAVIFRREGNYFLRDLNSGIGTFLNDQKIREAQLHNGDEIRVGTTPIRYGLNVCTNAAQFTGTESTDEKARTDYWLSQLSDAAPGSSDSGVGAATADDLGGSGVAAPPALEEAPEAAPDDFELSPSVAPQVATPSPTDVHAGAVDAPTDRAGASVVNAPLAKATRPASPVPKVGFMRRLRTFLRPKRVVKRQTPTVATDRAPASAGAPDLGEIPVATESEIFNPGDIGADFTPPDDELTASDIFPDIKHDAPGHS
jgi:pSer/pThr/pTyr-binding forkhead associated (FHA) protein